MPEATMMQPCHRPIDRSIFVDDDDDHDAAAAAATAAAGRDDADRKFPEAFFLSRSEVAYATMASLFVWWKNPL